MIGIGTGLSSPASRNAGLQLAPDQSATIAALRSTGRQVGQIIAVSVTTAIIAQSAAPGPLQAKVFVAFAVAARRLPAGHRPRPRAPGILVTVRPAVAGICVSFPSWRAHPPAR